MGSGPQILAPEAAHGPMLLSAGLMALGALLNGVGIVNRPVDTAMAGSGGFGEVG